jgi:hypothetical protein
MIFDEKIFSCMPACVSGAVFLQTLPQHYGSLQRLFFGKRKDA